MITRQSYALFLAQYHAALLIAAIVLGLLACRALGWSEKPARWAWPVTLLGLFQAIGIGPMAGYIRAHVRIRDESLNFLITHSAIAMIVLLIGWTLSVRVKQKRSMLHFAAGCSIAAIALGWLTN